MEKEKSKEVGPANNEDKQVFDKASAGAAHGHDQRFRKKMRKGEEKIVQAVRPVTRPRSRRGGEVVVDVQERTKREKKPND